MSPRSLPRLTCSRTLFPSCSTVASGRCRSPRTVSSLACSPSRMSARPACSGRCRRRLAPLHDGRERETLGGNNMSTYPQDGSRPTIGKEGPMTDNALKPTAPAIPEATRWLALGAVAGPVLFTLAWFVLGFLSPGFTIFGTVIEPYSPVSQPISGLGLGSTAPFMNAAFVLSGILLMAGVIGIFQTLTIRTSSGPAARWTCVALL